MARRLPGSGPSKDKAAAKAATPKRGKPGPFKAGAAKAGAPETRAPKTGAPKTGAPKTGAAKTGAPKGGRPVKARFGKFGTTAPRAEAPPEPQREQDDTPAPQPNRPFRKRPERAPAAEAPEPPRRRLPRNESRPMPSREDIRRFLRSAPGRVGKTEIARHFGLTTEQRPELRELLRGLKEDGGAAQVGKKHFRAPERLPEMAVVEVFGTDPDGDPLARPLQWDAAQGRPPLVYMKPEPRGFPALAPGERVLARLRHIGGEKYEGRTFKRIGGAAPARILGVFEGGGTASARIIPTDRRQKGEWMVPSGSENGAQPGDIVLAEPMPSQRSFGPRPAQVVERLGKMGEPRSVSLVCIHAHGIPDVFPAEAVREAEKAKGVTARGREDLRDLPLVTIDGEDARDFDDAVHAEPDGDGWKVTVAIADVCHYVKPDSPLDREAWARGNSVYFPDRVVPMLPEALSNGWCSLRPEEDRGCLFVEMWFDGAGTKSRHRFGRGIMRSAARLTYEQVQQAQDAGLAPPGLPRSLVENLYGAFQALLSARARRGTLELDIPERKVVLDAHGKVAGVAPRPRLDSHKLIEEFMVAANVCAAEQLEALHQPCMYRVHDRPSDQKLEGLRQFLGALGINLPPADALHPRNFTHVLEMVKGKPEERVVNETVLRGQSQAAYAPENIGHFGLALSRYAHFTSPIRRYADLLVHRALVRGLKLGAGALEETEAARFTDSAEHITQTERRAAMAERDAVDRYLAAFMSERIGHVFDARISGVTRFGLFVTVEENGASGIVPLASLPDDRWMHDEATHSVAGRRTGLTFTLGQAVEARLVEATPRTGGMVFQLMQGDPRSGGRSKAEPRANRRGRR